MPRDYKVYFEDIAVSSGKIIEYTRDLSYEKFCADSKTVDAVIRNMITIGEAIKNIPEEVRSQNSEIDWRRISGLRDILVHEYFGADNEMIWGIIKNKLPVFHDQIRKILSR